MSEKKCKNIDKIERNETRLNSHSERIKVIERDIVGMKKDTSRLEMILNKLEIAIENLNTSILEMKYKPLDRYEKVVMVVITTIITYIASKILI